ncbi:MAG: 5'/3'-nucleotidase SurE [Acidobacteria bacterium]|nr:5'/3'-nucleotidase SurE [Acidobacteriota bacterium]
MKRILVTNDDGIDSRGLQLLAEAMQSLGDVYIIAPSDEMSAISHALTLHAPLQYKKVDNRKFRIYGTPSDCVYLGVFNIMKNKPDLIVSGINSGPNMGDDITYSGTVAAAIEGTLLEIPSIAFSLFGNPPSKYEQVLPYCRSIGAKILEEGLPKNTLLNVNFPDEPIRGMKITRLGRRKYKQYVDEIKNPRGKTYYWIGGDQPEWEKIENSDYQVVNNGYVSVTPLHLDLTDYAFLDKLNKWDFKIQ